MRRKEYLVLVTMNPEAIGTSEYNITDRKKFQIRFGSYAMRMTSVVLRETTRSVQMQYYLLSCRLLLFTGKEKMEDEARSIFLVSKTEATASAMNGIGRLYIQLRYS